MKIGLPCLMHIHENEILLAKFPTVCMECNGIKYCGAADDAQPHVDSDFSTGFKCFQKNGWKRVNNTVDSTNIFISYIKVLHKNITEI